MRLGAAQAPSYLFSPPPRIPPFGPILRIIAGRSEHGLTARTPRPGVLSMVQAEKLFRYSRRYTNLTAPLVKVSRVLEFGPGFRLTPPC